MNVASAKVGLNFSRTGALQPPSRSLRFPGRHDARKAMEFCRRLPLETAGQIKNIRKPAIAGYVSKNTGGLGRNRTGVRGFAGRCMTTLPPGR